ncbi:hypothetical protein [Aerococcus kribbianus]|uniref:Uncharacterized protein n=1 Tax=Aerococcus kribbianus TaxID=2999064 RepID=A0A9X3FNS0_9LACT|nr:MULTISPECIES: hypothetical protein [unclassified Aerococcus]MCZ0717856.1 hypothetical protein [Aerococcus sp. YH-aer221]MCZ0726143.1 hypothetical protein [Aerococcus sp. YH-aer222]
MKLEMRDRFALIVGVQLLATVIFGLWTLNNIMFGYIALTLGISCLVQLAAIIPD